MIRAISSGRQLFRLLKSLAIAAVSGDAESIPRVLNSSRQFYWLPNGYKYAIVNFKCREAAANFGLHVAYPLPLNLGSVSSYRPGTHVEYIFPMQY